ncbi:hypothetical protein KGF41_13910 [Clostridioides sp. ZZV14-6150]|uniref:hypothetical protein n=1 Tax=Clostridioides sp. ZZV14-6150 TaxID=2811493 RepID=UPI001D105FC8|nr:hypothetical protein [Clostridioides sp. ZZV14-6150]
MEFKKEFLKEQIEHSVCNSVIDTSRWSISHEMIFEYKGKFYRTYYSEGATEMQDESPFEYEDDIIECEEVELKEILVKKWVSVK